MYQQRLNRLILLFIETNKRYVKCN